MGVEERFGEFSKPNYFSRVDSDHVLELFIGLDEQGRKAIELRSLFAPRKITGTASIEVNQYKREEYNTIRFSLVNDEVSGLYYKFCDDIIEQTRDIHEKTEGYQAVVNRFFMWKKTFIPGNKNLLTEPEIMGLIGELLFLKNDLSKRIGLADALRAWSGQELTHKDFSAGESWYEIKTIHRGKASVKISSIEQLESDNEGELIVYSLEKMSEAYKGITLNELVLDTMNLFETQEEKEDFWAKVSLHGYEFNNYYDSFVFEISNSTKYSVREGFPRLQKNLLPKAIIKASYELQLTDIKEFELSE